MTTPQNKLSEAIIAALSSINDRISILETKVSILAVNAGLVDYCDCHQEPKDRIMLEGMPCCPICEKIIKKFIILPEAAN